ncbi:MAG: type II toxin-antitoxin system VapC family toxin [Gemmatimonadota bacterium]
MLLVDTSVWIEFFRRPQRADVAGAFELEEAVTCLPVIQEVLQGFRDEDAFRLARGAMLAFPIVESPLAGEVYLEAVALYRTARRAGVTVRSSVDCLIAACALRHDLTIFHHDRDYDALAAVSALRVRSLFG